MLDEAEFARWHEVLAEGVRRAEARRRSGIVVPPHEEFQPALEEYERVSGFRETNINAIWHHRLSLYGPDCARCGKPLRTPAARFCAACGAPAGRV